MGDLVRRDLVRRDLVRRRENLERLFFLRLGVLRFFFSCFERLFERFLCFENLRLLRFLCFLESRSQTIFVRVRSCSGT